MVERRPATTPIQREPDKYRNVIAIISILIGIFLFFYWISQREFWEDLIVIHFSALLAVILDGFGFYKLIKNRT